MNGISLIVKLGEKVLNGEDISREEAESLGKIEEEDVAFLLSMADKIRSKFIGKEVDLCAIVNGRSGRCSENCKYCAQSKYHNTNVAVYPFLSVEEILAKAKEAEMGGANRFAIVTSGKGMEGDQEFPKILAAFRRILTETNLKVCCSLGALTMETARALKDAGVSRYHHNIETSRNNYKNICTTHTYEDRLKTIEIAHQAGLEVCSGGILGMNETLSDRISMAFDLRQAGVHSVPLNILNPIKGTAFEHQPPLSPLEILKSVAIFRFILPKCGIRTAGGREVNLRDLQGTALLSGISGMLVGGYLTTGGRKYQDDLKMIADLGRKAAK
ncbi:biotin synthase BioB [Anaerosinus gibii]|uniref:Biotin synthase n=1 Tax=Selenobaculum gibii TaxID=3054208 RepID=A0A9Y2AFM4_9FIRM|nr:biotin synthase BioB [Selenobaculum gbiensis]WIW70765.1 biotin synthase BioB [Selenobaculum gbiensis]